MFIELSKLSTFELFKLYNAVGCILFFKIVGPIILALFTLYCLLWITDKKMC